MTAKTLQFELHRAEWVVPVTSEPISDGAVLAGDGRIVAVGPYAEIARQVPSGTVTADHGACAIIPGLVNAHTHLELSALRGAISFPQPGFSAWISEFFRIRSGLGADAVAQGFENAKREAYDAGTVLCGDITNGAFAAPGPGNGLVERHVFLELLGFNCRSMETAWPRLGPDELPDLESAGNLGPLFSICAHAPYSVSPEVIGEAKRWSRQRGLPFSIHTAEHAEEVELLDAGGGFCRELLDGLGRWEPSWKPPGASPVRYLDRLGVLDEATLLVHAVHMSAADWDIVSARRCHVCFCPRSNRNVGVGRADIGKALSLGIPAALGTDSLASNTDLSLFAEAAFVLENYPSVPASSVLRMATLGGARALCRAHQYGSMEPGKRSALLAVFIPPNTARSLLTETLIVEGKKGAFEWISRPEKD